MKRRLPSALTVETLMGVCAVVFVILGVARPWDPGARLDLISVASILIALVALAVLMMRQRGAIGRADEKAASEATRARRDFLTNLPNRLAADAALEGLLARGAALMDGSLTRSTSERGVIPFWHGAAYIAIDLDEFKPVNDDCGHAEGDRLLCEIADILRSVAGPGDLVARVGGDEFSVLMSERDVEQARVLACSIRDSLRAHHFAAGGRRYPVSGSIGLVRVAPSDTDPNEIREAADAAAYAAKEAGRDAVFEVQSRGADPVRLDSAESEVAGQGAAKLLAYRMATIGAAGEDRLEFRLDPQGGPPTVGRAFKHIAMLGCAASMIDPEIPVSVVCPAVIGDGDLATLGRIANRLGIQRPKNTTVFLELPRRRGEHNEMAAVVAALRACKLQVGIVCRTHSLSGIAQLSELAPDELELHLSRAPAGTLEAYALLADAGRWRLSVADLASEDGLKALISSPVQYVGGPAIGEGGPPTQVVASLRLPYSRGGFATNVPLGRTRTG